MATDTSSDLPTCKLILIRASAPSHARSIIHAQGLCVFHRHMACAFWDMCIHCASAASTCHPRGLTCTWHVHVTCTCQAHLLICTWHVHFYMHMACASSYMRRACAFSTGTWHVHSGTCTCTVHQPHPHAIHVA